MILILVVFILLTIIGALLNISGSAMQTAFVCTWLAFIWLELRCLRENLRG